MSDSDVFTAEDLIRFAAEVRGEEPQPLAFLVHPADKIHVEEHDEPDCPRCQAIWATAQRVRL